MYAKIFWGIIIPFIGTCLGSACTYFIGSELNRSLKRAISGFAGGVMIAASVWSLLIPALEHDIAVAFGAFSFLPAVLGLWMGVMFLLAIDKAIPDHNNALAPGALKQNKMLFLSVSIHNLPEGMAIGVIYAAILASQNVQALGGAFALSLGIAVQNFPEGAIISMPLASEGMNKTKAFIYGAISGVIEPIGAILTITAISVVVPILPVLLGFAAGAMIYTVIKELFPDVIDTDGTFTGVISFSVGFTIMMILDEVLG